MKYSRLLISIVLFISLMMSVTVAGNESSSKVFSTVKKQKQIIPTDGSDILGINKLKKSNMVSTFDRKVLLRSKPEPLKQITSIPPLSGTYSIPGNFPSLEYAVATLNAVGVSGDVTFQLVNSSYLEHSITFGSYSGNTAYSVTISPKLGKHVNIAFLSSSTDGKGFAFNGASNIHIDGINNDSTSLTLLFNNLSTFPSGDPFGATIYAVGASHDISINNCTIHGNIEGAFASQTDGRPAIFLFRAATDEASGNYNFTFDGNTIINATFGLKILCEDGSGDYYDQNSIWFTHNKIGGAYGGNVLIGCFTEFAWDFHYDYNIFDGIEFNDKYWNDGPTEWDIDWIFAGAPRSFLYTFGQYSAGHIYYSGLGSTMHDNWVKDVHNNITSNNGGILMYGFTNRLSLSNPRPLIYNNRITNVTSAENGSAQITGLRTQSVDLYYNSIRLTGAMPSSSATSVCISGTSGDKIKYNALSNEMTGGTTANIRGITNVAPTTTNSNAIYSSGYFVSGYSTAQGAVSAGYNLNGIFGPVNFTDNTLHITSGPSSAENLCTSSTINDIDGDSRNSSPTDAGADEFPNTGSPYGPDVMLGGFTSPVTGIPTGVPQTPNVTVKNNSNIAVGSFNVTVTISDGYSQVVNVAGLAPLASQLVSFPIWTPSVANLYTFNAIASLADDIDPTNDSSASLTILASTPDVINETTYTWTTGDQGWTRSVDWVRNSTFTKLGGPQYGAAMVTERPNKVSTYTEGAYASTQGYPSNYPGANILTSPWMNLSTMPGTDLYISFYQSLNVEPKWDRSWLEYTTDGTSWNHVGVLNDPNGLNWYNTDLYENAAMDRANFDSASAIQYGLWTPPCPTDFPSWTSNDDGSPTDWIYSQLKLTYADYPTRSPHIRFRYVAFSDALTAPDPGGWAIDNFRIFYSPCMGAGSFQGKLFADLDGDSIFNHSDSVFKNTMVYLGHFGTYYDSTITDGSGDYSFIVGLPATYSIKTNLLGYAFTTPSNAGVSGIAKIFNNACYSSFTVNFGGYVGSVSGTVVNDVNNNGAKDSGEPGLNSYSIEVHKDSSGGTLMGTVICNSSGDWSMNLPPYSTYVAKLVPKSNGRQTFPLSPATITFSIGGASGSGTAVVTGQNFGVFLFASLTEYAIVDVNGNGIGDGDHTGLPSGASATYDFLKGSIKIDSNVNLGNGTLSKSYANLDTGSYSIIYTSTPAGWLTTNGPLTHSFTISNSGTVINDSLLSFKLVHVTGITFIDDNGDGLSAGDAVAEGRTVSITGNDGGSTVTDSTGSFEFWVGPGAHVLSQTLPSAEWVGTKPSGAGTYSFTSFSGSVAGQDQLNKDFGSFETYSISGTVYRDYNGNGSMDGADEGNEAITVSLTDQTDVLTANDGSFTFSGIGNGTKTLSVTAPIGYSVTFPNPTTYSVSSTSGTNITRKDFGLFQTSDGTKKYRTFTLEDLQTWASLKPVTRPKTGSAMPNIQNMYDEIFKQAKDSAKATGIIVGKKAQKLDPTNPRSKDKGYLLPLKASDLNATFMKKGKVGNIYQTGTSRGLDFLVGNSARILKANANLSPDKHNNILLGNMLALGINIAASDWGKTPSGLGDLIYIGIEPWNNMSVYDIYTSANDMMTNWEGISSSSFSNLNIVLTAINNEFSGTLDTATSWTRTSKLQWTGVKTVASSMILKAGSTISPRILTDQIWETEPTTFTLEQNYPNPFNPTTAITFTLPEDAVITIKVFNMLGQEVGTPVDNSTYFSGTYTEIFDAKNLTSGVYFYRVTADIQNSETGNTEHFTQTRKMLLTK